MFNEDFYIVRFLEPPCLSTVPTSAASLFYHWASFYFIYLFIYLFKWLCLRCMEFPRLGVKSELQLQTYTTAMATPDPSRLWDLRRSLWQHWILNPLMEPEIKPTSSWNIMSVLNLLSHYRNPRGSYFTHLCLIFLIHKTGIVRASTSKCCSED